MKKSSLKAADALQMGFGIQSGRIRVDDAAFENVQYIKGDGTPTAKFIALALTCMKLNDKNEPETGQTEQQNIIIGWANKETGELRFHPCKTPNATSDDIEDLGDEVGVRGNTFGNEAGDKPFADSDIALFMKTLELKGFKPEINEQCYAPNYIGLVVDVVTVEKAELCKRLGIKHTPGAQKEGKGPMTCWEVTNVHVRPYEKGAKGATKAATATAASGKANGKATPSPASAAPDTGDDATREKAAGFFAENAGAELSQSDMSKKMALYLSGAGVGMKEIQTFVNKVVKNGDALAMWGMESGLFEFDVESKKATIAETE